MKPARYSQIVLRVFSLLFLTALVSLSIGLALASLWTAFLLFCSAVVGFLLLAIWQENSLLMRAGTAVELSLHQASQLAAVESRVRHWAQVLSIPTPPLIYWRTFPTQQGTLVRSLGSPGILILDQGLFYRLNDRDWDTWIHDSLLALTRPEMVLRSFAQFWLGILAPDSWNAGGWRATQAFRWILFSPVRRFFVWFQL